MRRVKSSKDQIAATARHTFGFQTLRPGQQEAIDSVLLLDSPTVVISPLIALQKDQVDSLQQHSRGRKKDAFQDLESGDLKFIFVTPEQPTKAEILARIEQAKPSLFVVNEAYCISEWGHDFRAHFLKLGAAVEALGRPRILALTATASEPVREEIMVKGFDRPNIRLRVETFQTKAEKPERLLQRIG